MTDFKKKIWQGVLLINVAVIIFYWWQGSSALLTQGTMGLSIALGRLAGLLAVGTVLLQFSFMGRNPWLERVFGLDKLAKIHKTNGKLSLFFLIAHPVLLIYGYSKAAGVSQAEQFKDFILNYQYVNLSFIGLLLFILVVITSLVIIRRKFRYESWYFVHLLVYLAVFLSFWHQIELGTTILTNQVFYVYWISLYTIVLGSHVIFRFGRPLYLFQKHKFTVSKVVRENYNAVSIYITGKRLKDFHIKSGQFMIFRFLIKGMWWQAHPFSLSKPHHENEIRITVKELGDFTKQVNTISPGTKVLIDGPYGIFTDKVSQSSKVLFIAGGIGITPIRSLMEDMAKMGKDITFIYGNKTERDIVFKEEIRSFVSKYDIKVVHVLSDEPSYTGETGMIDEEKIKRLVPDVSLRDVYLCGPPPMMDAVVKTLQRLNVPASHIHYEKFEL